MTATVRPWPRLLGETLAAEYLSISTSTLWQRGPRPRHIGRRAVWDIQELDRWADALSGKPLDPQQREEEGDDIDRRVAERLAKRG